MSEEKPPRTRALPAPLTFGCGALMGAADSVPGVSGGTIALIIGVYERFIESLHTALRLPWLIREADGRGRLARAFRFLVPLILGMGLAYFLGTRLLAGPTRDPGLLRRADSAPYCYAFFLGLVLFSLHEPWSRIRERSAGSWGIAAVACVVVAWGVGLEHATVEPAPWMLIYGGALAVAVMLLPGVSGSLLLLVLGQYTAVTSALHDFDGLRLGLFALGILLGLATFIPVLRWMLRTKHDLVMAALTGLMAGSLRALWPWKNHYDLKDLEAGRMVNIGVQDGWPLVLAALAGGGLAAWLLARLHTRVERMAGGQDVS